MGFRRWGDVTSRDLGSLDAARGVAILPLAATEQHGPHLPTGTDHHIAEGLLAEAARLAPDTVDVLVLPTVAVGASLEHARFPGTLSFSATQFSEQIVALGEGVANAGLRKLVLVSSHGGNVAAMTSAALECRARFGLLAVTLTWSRLGLPPGLIDGRERDFGVHGGLVETALMLHFRPELVRLDLAGDFGSRQEDLARAYRRLRAYGPVGFGWLSGDLNPAGVTGNAAAASAETGRAIAAHQAAAFVELVADTAAIPLGDALSDS